MTITAAPASMLSGAFSGPCDRAGLGLASPLARPLDRKPAGSARVLGLKLTAKS
jgi:hypothetical protein